MERFGNLLGKLPPPKKKRGGTEWGELVDYFAKHAGWSFGRMAKKLEKQPVNALHFLKSGFDDRLRRDDKTTALKWMFWSINPNKHK